MTDADLCAECGAPLEGDRECREYLDECLAIEWETPGLSGSIVHFYTVASYNLQHPDDFRMSWMRQLRQSLTDAVSGRRTIAQLRVDAAAAEHGPDRVRLRQGDVETGADAELRARWPVEWPLTARDAALAGPAEYSAAATEWARAVVATLDAAIG